MEFPKEMSRKDEVSKRIREDFTKVLEVNERIELYRDEAVFESPTMKRLGDRAIEAEKTINSRRIGASRSRYPLSQGGWLPGKRHDPRTHRAAREPGGTR